MRIESHYIKTALMVLCMVFTMAVGFPALAQDKNQKDKDKNQKDKQGVSKEEAAAGKKIETAKDVPAKLQAADEFLKKYPKSSGRQEIARYIAREIGGIQDPSQRVSLGEQFFSIFTETGEIDLVMPTLVDAYLRTKKYDEAFQVAGNYLSRHPEDILFLTELAIQGTNQARAGNAKFAEKSAEYANKAIELMEANKKPASYDEAKWTSYKTGNLPLLYHSAGVLAMMGGKPSEAKPKLEKAVSLNPADPFNYYLLATIINEDYRKTAELFNASPPGQGKEELLVKANSQIDQVIDYYARAVAAAEGNPAYQNFVTQVRADLENYYKFRNKNSLSGLQELINRYKPAKP